MIKLDLFEKINEIESEENRRNYKRMLTCFLLFLKNLLQLIDCETPNFDYNPALTTCLKLTQNLARRVVVRRVPSMSFSIKEVI